MEGLTFKANLNSQLVRGSHISIIPETSPSSVWIAQEVPEVTYKDSCLQGVASFAYVKFESFETGSQVGSAPGAACPSTQGAVLQMPQWGLTGPLWASQRVMTLYL